MRRRKREFYPPLQPEFCPNHTQITWSIGGHVGLCHQRFKTIPVTDLANTPGRDLAIRARAVPVGIADRIVVIFDISA